MKEITLCGITIEVTDDGYFLEPALWSRNMAAEMAHTEGIALTEQHFLILEYIRKLFLEGHALTIRAIGNSGLTDIKGFYSLFPGAPMKKASKLAGVPKPASCI
jgi:tRNA 2-thiouridine synthesizing protein E